MTDEASHVNRPFSSVECRAARTSGYREHPETDFAVSKGPLGKATIALREANFHGPGRNLVNVLASPAEQCIELVRVDHEVNDERDRGQHEYQVSHGVFPAPTC
jgi:hypothetical protein